MSKSIKISFGLTTFYLSMVWWLPTRICFASQNSRGWKKKWFVDSMSPPQIQMTFISLISFLIRTLEPILNWQLPMTLYGITAVLLIPDVCKKGKKLLFWLPVEKSFQGTLHTKWINTTASNMSANHLPLLTPHQGHEFFLFSILLNLLKSSDNLHSYYILVYHL